MPANETGLVRQIVRDVAKAYPDAWIQKIHGSPVQTVGIPDLLIVVQGRMVGAEVKHQKPGESREHALGRASGAQLRQIDLLRKAGAVADVVLSSEETLALIEQALAGPSRN